MEHARSPFRCNQKLLVIFMSGSALGPNLVEDSLKKLNPQVYLLFVCWMFCVATAGYCMGWISIKMRWHKCKDESSASHWHDGMCVDPLAMTNTTLLFASDGSGAHLGFGALLELNECRPTTLVVVVYSWSCPLEVLVCTCRWLWLGISTIEMLSCLLLMISAQTFNTVVFGCRLRIGQSQPMWGIQAIMWIGHTNSSW